MYKFICANIVKSRNFTHSYRKLTLANKVHHDAGRSLSPNGQEGLEDNAEEYVEYVDEENGMEDIAAMSSRTPKLSIIDFDRLPTITAPTIKLKEHPKFYTGKISLNSATNISKKYFHLYSINPSLSAKRSYSTSFYKKFMSANVKENYKKALSELQDIKKKKTDYQFKTNVNSKGGLIANEFFAKKFNKKKEISYPTHTFKHHLLINRRYKIREGSADRKLGSVLKDLEEEFKERKNEHVKFFKPIGPKKITYSDLIGQLKNIQANGRQPPPKPVENRSNFVWKNDIQPLIKVLKQQKPLAELQKVAEEKARVSAEEEFDTLIKSHPTIQNASKEVKMKLKSKFVQILLNTSRKSPKTKGGAMEDLKMKSDVGEGENEDVLFEAQQEVEEENHKIEQRKEEPQKILLHPKALSEQNGALNVVKYPKGVLVDSHPEYDVDQVCIKETATRTGSGFISDNYSREPERFAYSKGEENQEEISTFAEKFKQLQLKSENSIENLKAGNEVSMDTRKKLDKLHQERLYYIKELEKLNINLRPVPSPKDCKEEIGKIETSKPEVQLKSKAHENESTDKIKSRQKDSAEKVKRILTRQVYKAKESQPLDTLKERRQLNMRNMKQKRQTYSSKNVRATTEKSKQITSQPNSNNTILNRMLLNKNIKNKTAQLKSKYETNKTTSDSVNNQKLKVEASKIINKKTDEIKPGASNKKEKDDLISEQAFKTRLENNVLRKTIEEPVNVELTSNRIPGENKAPGNPKELNNEIPENINQKSVILMSDTFNKITVGSVNLKEPNDKVAEKIVHSVNFKEPKNEISEGIKQTTVEVKPDTEMVCHLYGETTEDICNEVIEPEVYVSRCMKRLKVVLNRENNAGEQQENESEEGANAKGNERMDLISVNNNGIKKMDIQEPVGESYISKNVAENKKDVKPVLMSQGVSSSSKATLDEPSEIDKLNERAIEEKKKYEKTREKLIEEKTKETEETPQPPTKTINHIPRVNKVEDRIDEKVEIAQKVKEEIENITIKQKPVQPISKTDKKSPMVKKVLKVNNKYLEEPSKHDELNTVAKNLSRQKEIQPEVQKGYHLHQPNNNKKGNEKKINETDVKVEQDKKVKKSLEDFYQKKTNEWNEGVKQNTIEELENVAPTNKELQLQKKNHPQDNQGVKKEAAGLEESTVYDELNESAQNLNKKKREVVESGYHINQPEGPIEIRTPKVQETDWRIEQDKKVKKDLDEFYKTKKVEWGLSEADHQTEDKRNDTNTAIPKMSIQNSDNTISKNSAMNIGLYKKGSPIVQDIVCGTKIAKYYSQDLSSTSYEKTNVDKQIIKKHGNSLEDTTSLPNLQPLYIPKQRLFVNRIKEVDENRSISEQQQELMDESGAHSDVVELKSGDEIVILEQNLPKESAKTKVEIENPAEIACKIESAVLNIKELDKNLTKKNEALLLKSIDNGDKIDEVMEKINSLEILIKKQTLHEGKKTENKPRVVPPQKPNINKGKGDNKKDRPKGSKDMILPPKARGSQPEKVSKTYSEVEIKPGKEIGKVNDINTAAAKVKENDSKTVQPSKSEKTTNFDVYTEKVWKYCVKKANLEAKQLEKDEMSKGPKETEVEKKPFENRPASCPPGTVRSLKLIGAKRPIRSSSEDKNDIASTSCPAKTAKIGMEESKTQYSSWSMQGHRSQESDKPSSSAPKWSATSGGSNSSKPPKVIYNFNPLKRAWKKDPKAAPQYQVIELKKELYEKARRTEENNNSQINKKNKDLPKIFLAVPNVRYMSHMVKKSKNKKEVLELAKELAERKAKKEKSENNLPKVLLSSTIGKDKESGTEKILEIAKCVADNNLKQDKAVGVLKVVLPKSDSNVLTAKRSLESGGNKILKAGISTTQRTYKLSDKDSKKQKKIKNITEPSKKENQEKDDAEKKAVFQILCEGEVSVIKKAEEQFAEKKDDNKGKIELKPSKSEVKKDISKDSIKAIVDELKDLNRHNKTEVKKQVDGPGEEFIQPHIPSTVQANNNFKVMSMKPGSSKSKVNKKISITKGNEPYIKSNQNEENKIKKEEEDLCLMKLNKTYSCMLREIEYKQRLKNKEKQKDHIQEALSLNKKYSLMLKDIEKQLAESRETLDLKTQHLKEITSILTAPLKNKTKLDINKAEELKCQLNNMYNLNIPETIGKSVGKSKDSMYRLNIDKNEEQNNKARRAHSVSGDTDNLYKLNFEVDKTAEIKNLLERKRVDVESIENNQGIGKTVERSSKADKTAEIQKLFKIKRVNVDSIENKQGIGKTMEKSSTFKVNKIAEIEGLVPEKPINLKLENVGNKKADILEKSVGNLNFKTGTLAIKANKSLNLKHASVIETKPHIASDMGNFKTRPSSAQHIAKNDQKLIKKTLSVAETRNVGEILEMKALKHHPIEKSNIKVAKIEEVIKPVNKIDTQNVEPPKKAEDIPGVKLNSEDNITTKIEKSNFKVKTKLEEISNKIQTQTVKTVESKKVEDISDGASNLKAKTPPKIEEIFIPAKKIANKNVKNAKPSKKEEDISSGKMNSEKPSTSQSSRTETISVYQSIENPTNKLISKSKSLINQTKSQIVEGTKKWIREPSSKLISKENLEPEIKSWTSKIIKKNDYMKTKALQNIKSEEIRHKSGVKVEEMPKKTKEIKISKSSNKDVNNTIWIKSKETKSSKETLRKSKSQEPVKSKLILVQRPVTVADNSEKTRKREELLQKIKRSRVQENVQRNEVKNKKEQVQEMNEAAEHIMKEQKRQNFEEMLKGRRRQHMYQEDMDGKVMQPSVGSAPWGNKITKWEQNIPLREQRDAGILKLETESTASCSDSVLNEDKPKGTATKEFHSNTTGSEKLISKSEFLKFKEEHKAKEQQNQTQVKTEDKLKVEGIRMNLQEISKNLMQENPMTPVNIEKVHRETIQPVNEAPKLNLENLGAEIERYMVQIDKSKVEKTSDLKKMKINPSSSELPGTDRNTEPKASLYKKIEQEIQAKEKRRPDLPKPTVSKEVLNFKITKMAKMLADDMNVNEGLKKFIESDVKSGNDALNENKEFLDQKNTIMNEKLMEDKIIKKVSVSPSADQTSKASQNSKNPTDLPKKVASSGPVVSKLETEEKPVNWEKPLFEDHSTDEKHKEEIERMIELKRKNKLARKAKLAKSDTLNKDKEESGTNIVKGANFILKPENSLPVSKRTENLRSNLKKCPKPNKVYKIRTTHCNKLILPMKNPKFCMEDLLENCTSPLEKPLSDEIKTVPKAILELEAKANLVRKSDPLAKYRHLKITYMTVKRPAKSVNEKFLPAVVKDIDRKEVTEEEKRKIIDFRYELLKRLNEEFVKQSSHQQTNLPNIPEYTNLENTSCLADVNESRNAEKSNEAKMNIAKILEVVKPIPKVTFQQGLSNCSSAKHGDAMTNKKLEGKNKNNDDKTGPGNGTRR